MRLNPLVVCLAALITFNVSAAPKATQAVAGKAPAKSVQSPDKGVEKVIAGPVVSVNSDKKEVTITRSGKQYTVLLDGSTKVLSGNQPTSLDMIKTGEVVTINYLRFADGSRIALNIEAPAGLKKAETKTEAKKEASAAAKADVVKAETKTEAKKEASATAKADVVKAETKVEAKKEASATAKADVVKAETKVEAKKEASTAAKADVVKAETKVEAKKEASAAAKAEVKAEPKAEVKAVPKKESAATPKTEAPVDPKKDAVSAPAKVQN